MLRYNHYRHELPVTVPPGAVPIAAIDDTFSFSYGFKGNYVIHLTHGQDGPMLPQDATAISGLQLGEEYWCVVDEDPEELKKERKALVEPIPK